jgi:arabinofuranosyltransferase
VGAWAAIAAAWLHVSPGPGFIDANGIADERGYYVAPAHRPHPIDIDEYADLATSADGHALREAAAAHHTAYHPQVLLDVYWPDAATEGPRRPRAYGLKPEYRDPGIDLVTVRTDIGMTGFVAGPHVHIVDAQGLADPLGSRLVLGRHGRPGHEKLLSEPWVIARFTLPPAGPEDEAVTAARAALECGPLPELLAAVHDPLTPARFLRNVRASIALHRLRIPPDPRQARVAFCGG